MTCREHTSKSRCEVRCEVCGLIKPKDQFSKNSLKLDEYVSASIGSLGHC